MSQASIKCYQDESDESLVKKATAGETRAFDVLVLRHSKRLHLMLLQILRSEADAYDVAQDAFIKAFTSLRYFNGKSAFYTWLYSIALNHTRNFLRKRKRERTSSLDRDDFEIALDKRMEIADPTSEPTKPIEDNELMAQIKQAIAQLPLAQREVVVLVDIMEMSYAEVSEILNVREGTLRSRLHYAHQQLQGLLADVWKERGGRKHGKH